MIDPITSWAFGIIAGASVGFWIGRWWPQRDPFTRWWRRSPYSCGAIWMAATKEEAEKFGSRFIDPSVDEPWPKPMTVDDWARSITFPDPAPDRQPTNPFTGGPVKPEPPSGRVVDIHGRTIGRIPRSQGDTPNPPPTAP